MRRLSLIALTLGLACEAKQPKPTPPAEPDPQPKAAPAPVDASPPPERLSVPLPILDMRLGRRGGAGQIEWPDGKALPLEAVGLNLCETGYVLQAFFRDAKGHLQATPALPLPELIAGADYHHTEPSIPGQALVTKFDEASMRKLRGTIRLVTDTKLEPVLRLDVDAVPIGVASTPGLGAQGCYTTGRWTLHDDGKEIEGPTSAVWDNKVTHWVSLRLDETHAVEFWLTLPPQHRQPGRMVRGDLARIGQDLKNVPFRVVFTERDGIEKREIPAESGGVTAAFTRANPQGPLRVELTNLAFPKWRGPHAGETVDLLRAETLIVTDLKGAQVPVPSDGTVQK